MADAKIFIETERLFLRELVPEDAEGMFALDSDTEVHHYIGQQPVRTIEESRQVIEILRAQYAANGIGRWAVIEKTTGQFIGWSGLKLDKVLTNGYINYYDLGYRFMTKHWGKGYATEAAKAWVKYGFETMGLKEIFGRVNVDNIASQKVIENAGLKYVNTFDCEGIKHKWYRAIDAKTI